MEFKYNSGENIIFSCVVSAYTPNEKIILRSCIITCLKIFFNALYYPSPAPPLVKLVPYYT